MYSTPDPYIAPYLCARVRALNAQGLAVYIIVGWVEGGCESTGVILNTKAHAIYLDKITFSRYHW